MVESLYNVKETAKLLKISERQVWRYIKSEKLKIVKLSPRIIRVSERDLQEFIKNNK